MYVYLGYTVRCFDMHLQCEMIITTKLTNTVITSHICCVCVCVCVCVRQEHERSDLSKSQVYDTVLLTPVTVLYIRFQEL